MGSKIQVPNNIEDKTVLKRFLTDLVLGINSSTLFSGNVQEQNAALVGILQTNPNVDFLNVVSKLNELRTDILTYVEENLETIILQQQEDIAVIAEQFGTFYQQALAASWYGLSVKAGGAVAGLEIGSLDPDVTTPGDENSYFRVIADNFIVGRAYEDLTPEEKDYLATNNLPSFGTVYNEDKTPMPALIITWDSVNKTYKHYFNGIVNFVNVETNTGTLDEVLAVQTSKLAKLEETDDGVVHSFYQTSAPSTSVSSYGDWWVDTDSNPLKAYRYEDINSKNVGTLAWRDNSTSIIGKAYISAVGAQATADGKISTFYSITTPSNPSIGDLWVHSTTNITKRWSGSTWNVIDTAVAINNGATTINGGRITTNTLEANVLKPASGGSTVWSGGALVSQNFNGNPVGGIGSPTQGFRLSSNAAGSATDPNIYGAYIKGATLEGSSIKLREITVLTDSNYETKAIIGASSILSGTIWTYDIYPYNSIVSTRNRLAKSSNNTIIFAGNTINSNVSSYVSYRGWVSLAVSTGGIQSGSYPYSYNNVFTITIDGTSHTFSADTQTSPYKFPCGLTLVTVFTITNVNTGSGYTCLFVKPYCDSFTLASGNLTINVSNLAGSLIMDSRYGNEVIVYNI